MNQKPSILGALAKSIKTVKDGTYTAVRVDQLFIEKIDGK
jgi:hypothetical protein